MTISDAIKLLEQAPDTMDPCPVNPSLTCSDAKNLLIAGIADLLLTRDESDDLPHLYEKRVLQVARSQRRPRF